MAEQSARNQVDKLVKDPALIGAILKLCDRWGDFAFDVVDHWEANLHGVGVARRDDHQVLIYVENYEQPSGVYTVELEGQPVAGSEQPFSVIGSQEALSFEDLSSLVGQYLGLTQTSPTS